MSSLARSSSSRFTRPGAVRIIVPLIVIVFALAAALGWSFYMRAQDRAVAENHGELIASMTGLGRPTKNVLAARFTDANKDLVADAPANATELLDPAEIVFTYVASDENTSKLEAVFKPFTDALTTATGKPVRYLPVGDVDTELNAMNDGKLHVCAFNTGAVPTAVDVVGFVPVAVLGGDGGPSMYQLKIIASPRSGIGSIDALRGRELALTDMSSNSGYKAPLVLLQQKFNMRPGFDFGIRYSQGYAPSIDGLVDGTFDAIAVASDVLARAELAGKIKPTDYRVLYTSDPFPTACFGYAHNLKPELAEKIRGALMRCQFKDAATAAFFGASGETKLVGTDYAKDFTLVREIDDTIGYEHKLRPPPPAPEQSATMPTTAESVVP